MMGLVRTRKHTIENKKNVLFLLDMVLLGLISRVLVNSITLLNNTKFLSLLSRKHYHEALSSHDRKSTFTRGNVVTPFAFITNDQLASNQPIT